MIQITDDLITLQEEIFKVMPDRYKFVNISNIFGEDTGNFTHISVKTAKFYYTFYNIEDFIEFFNRQEILNRKF